MDKIKKIRTKINSIRHELEIGADLNKKFVNMIIQSNSYNKTTKRNFVSLKNNNS